jgi:uncharacterized sodium:solute symporter family permease YidK
MMIEKGYSSNEMSLFFSSREVFFRCSADGEDERRDVDQDNWHVTLLHGGSGEMEMTLCLINRILVSLLMQQYLGLCFDSILGFLFLLGSARAVNTFTEDTYKSIVNTKHRTRSIVKKEQIVVFVEVVVALMSQWFVLVNEDKIITALNLSHWSSEETLPLLWVFLFLFCG